jgi:hypothetical protein
MRRSSAGLDRVDTEILGEKAAALGRAGERLEAALAELGVVARGLSEAGDDGQRDELRAAYRAARERARIARWHLLIQREAVGLRSHRVVDQQFPEPTPPPWL